MLISQGNRNLSFEFVDQSFRDPRNTAENKFRQGKQSVRSFVALMYSRVGLLGYRLPSFFLSLLPHQQGDKLRQERVPQLKNRG